MLKSIKIISVIFLFLFSLIPLAFGAPLTDPFYDQMQEVLNTPPIHGVTENVDLFSGNLNILHTDVHLPGNGGLDLTIMRKYNNSGIWGSRDVPSLIAYLNPTPLGYGWSMHMGIVKNVGSSSPVIEMADGSQHPLYRLPNQSGVYITKEYWIYKAAIDLQGHSELTLSDGTVYTFEHSSSTNQAGYWAYHVPVAQAIKIQNATKTATISIQYDRTTYTGGYSLLKRITDSVGRVLTFNYSTSSKNTPQLDSIVLNSYTQLIKYKYALVSGQNGSTVNILSQAVLPAAGEYATNGNWKYTYYPNLYELQTITYPTGGTITYEYTDVPFDVGSGTIGAVKFSVVTKKTTGGNRITPGTWNYSYATGGSSGNVTTVTTTPDNIREVHTFNAWGNCTSGSVWRIGLPARKDMYSGSSQIYSEATTWSPSAAISNDQISNASWNKNGGQITDLHIYAPLQASKSITRDGQTYTTTYTGYDSFGNPGTITETGDAGRTRTTTIPSYWYSTEKNVVANKPNSTTVTGNFTGSETFTTNYQYYSDYSGYPVGNIKQIKKYGSNGATTDFVYDSYGNLHQVTDANGKTTTYAWSNGRISSKTVPSNPGYTISRVINADATIQSQTDGRGYGHTTTYSYDGNLRLTLVNPPSIQNDTSISYAADNSTKTQTKGGYSVTTSYDGFGRETGTTDSKGIRTTVTYNPYGIKTSTISNVGDTTNYDFFGRPTSIQHQDRTSISYAYSGSNVSVTDEAGKQTTLTYNAFGNPDEKLLMGVTDAAGHTTSYSYNILGSLLAINQAGIGARTFTYDGKNFLVAEQHPDRGTINYGRDSVGNMHTKSDSLGTTNYGYDDINRLTSASNSSGSISYGYDNADNRTTVNNNGAHITYDYDAVNRMTRKTESILSQSYVTQYDYDANDNLTGIDYPLGRHVTYGYNSLNQVTSVTGFGASITGISYYTSGTAIGLPHQYTFSNGHTTTFSYNNRNLTTGITAGSSALNIGYGYDSRGNTTSITNNLYPAENRTFGYDDLNRLLTINGSWGGYTYDSWGNRQTKKFGSNLTSYSYSNNRLTSSSAGDSFGYNNDGDMTSHNSYVLNYDDYHNLTSYVTGTNTLGSYTYDGSGMRLTKSANGKTTVYHYDQGGRVLSETDQNKHLLADYVYLHGKLVAKLAPLPPTAPTNLDAWPAYANQINLSWMDNADNELGHTIERKTGENGTYAVIATVGPNVTTYSDTALTPGVTYYYQIRGYNQVGTSAYSNSGNAIPVSNPIPAISALPVSWNFGAVVVGSTATTKTFAISNTGTNDLLIGTLFITGANTGSFTIPSSTDNCTGRTLVPHNTHPNTCTFVVSFAPIIGGLNNANVTIPSNDPNTPQTNLTLQGMGQYTLAMQKTGTGAGTVTSTPAGINCGTSCAANYDGGTSITLTANPDSNSSFNGWSGSACSGLVNPCTFELSSHTTATATFNILPPIANFSASQTTVGTVPFEPVTFTDSSIRAYSWLWDFGDGTTSTLQNPVHTYTSVGTYTVSLLVSNPTGTNTRTVANYITVQPCPSQPVRINRGNGTTLIPYQTLQAAYNAAQNQDIIEALAVNFIENVNLNRPITVTINGGFACGYSQQIGNSTIQGQVTTSDGTITIGNFEIVGSAPGSVYDIVAVTGVGGNITPAGIITIAQGRSHTFTITPNSGYYINDVLVDGMSVGAVQSYTFNNVTTNHRIEASFTTTAPTMPVADFSCTPRAGVVPVNITCTDISTQAPYQWLWNFGDGATSTLKNPAHTYSAVGNYTITLTVTNSVGSNTVTKSNYIAALSVPPAVRIAGATPVYYPTIQAAYDAATNGAVIQVRDASLVENLIANRDITISLEGGYNSDYSTDTGVTPLQGSIAVNAGTVNIKNFNLVQ